MASGAVYQAIRDFLTAEWSTSDLVFENEPYTPDPDRPWVMVEIAGGAYAQQSIGAGTHRDNRWDESGTLHLSVMVRSGSGAITARNHAWALVNLFRGKLLGQIEFMDASIGLGGVYEADGNWFSIPLTIEWRVTDAQP